MDPGTVWTLPAASTGLARALYFFRGDTLVIAGSEIEGAHRIDLPSEESPRLEAGDTACEILLLQGRPIGEAVASHGPFVMNSQDEIHQAYSDYQQDGFGGWKWKSDAPVHPREQDRFALHADGRRDVPS